MFSPTSGKFRIDIDNSNEIRKIESEIYNEIGEKILEQNHLNEIDISNFPQGIYFVKIIDGDEYFVKKIILN